MPSVAATEPVIATVGKIAGKMGGKDGLMDVVITEKPNIEEVDQEIVVVAGC